MTNKQEVAALVSLVGHILSDSESHSQSDLSSCSDLSDSSGGVLDDVCAMYI